jgi:hypothetical protein
MPIHFSPADWYYQLRSDLANVYSSARGLFVPVADANFQTWLEGPDSALAITETKEDIGGALAPYKVTTPLDAGVLAGWNEARKLLAPSIVASAHATIQAGAITVSGSPFNIAGATYLAKGSVRFTFINPAADTNYSAMITAAGASAEISDLATDAFTINVGHGPQLTPFDPKYIDLIVFSK